MASRLPDLLCLTIGIAPCLITYSCDFPAILVNLHEQRHAHLATSCLYYIYIALLIEFLRKRATYDKLKKQNLPC